MDSPNGLPLKPGGDCKGIVAVAFLDEAVFLPIENFFVSKKATVLLSFTLALQKVNVA